MINRGGVFVFRVLGEKLYEKKLEPPGFPVKLGHDRGQRQLP